MKSYWSIFVLTSVLMLISAGTIYSQTEQVYDEGTVWEISFIRTGANVTEDYLKGIKNTWEADMKEQVKAGLIKSYKILLGSAANEQDFNIILMIELENFAALDPTPEKIAAARNISKKIEENMKGEFQKTVSNYENIRKWMGMKLMREVTLR